MNYCVNCKYFSTTISTNCLHPNLGISPVTGGPKPMFASSVRNSPYKCGEEGKWFEEKSKPHVPPKDTPPVVRWVKTLFSRSDS